MHRRCLAPRLRHAAALLGLLLALPAAAVPAVPFEVTARYDHRTAAFTEGLEVVDGAIYESSGLNRQSYFARWTLDGKEPIRKQALPDEIFGEGLTVLGERIYVLSWQNRRALIFDRKTWKQIGEFAYTGEGWGLTNDGRQLIMSDGTANLRFLDPKDGRVVRTVAVQVNGKPLVRLNELERVGNRILANIWQTDTVAVIDPESGAVTARIDLANLYPKGLRKPGTDVLNGIALDPADKTLLVTGKFWPTVYRLRLLQPLP